MRLQTFLIFELFFKCVLLTNVKKENSMSDINFKQMVEYRLPSTIVPSHYVIEISTYFGVGSPLPVDEFLFNGHCQITLKAIESNVQIIKLHTNNLNINYNLLKLHEVNDVTAINITHNVYDNVTQILSLHLISPLKVNVNYLLTFEYTGYIGENLDGLYRSYYMDNMMSQTKVIVTTQLGLTSARRVFPCFDEPQFKATFILKINHPSHLTTTLSNTHIVDTKTINQNSLNLTQNTFHQTPLMSTYLLAFSISDFIGTENSNKSYGIFARPEASSQTHFSYTYGLKSLQKLNEWFDYDYYSIEGIDNMQMIAIPDFSFGAMENWALMTFRETALLFDPNESNAKAQQFVGMVVTHEQVHMWFGNLVTCEWWSYAWLNEGFATYFQYFITALLEPSWHVDLQFTVDQLQTAFVVDSTESIHPMTNFDVNSPIEILSMFDSITYNKAASVIRMVAHLIGQFNFQIALRNYLNKNAMNTSTPEKLYSALQQQIDVSNNLPEYYNIESILNSWTEQSGFPVLLVDVQNTRKEILLSQKRFLLKTNSNKTFNEKWDIPINYVTNFESNFEETNVKFILYKSENELYSINFTQEIDWIIVNVQQTGYYRINYDEKTWTNIGKALSAPNHSGVHVLNRAQIIDDVMNLARSEMLNYELALSVFQYLENEKHYVPWTAGWNSWKYIMDRFTFKELPLAKKFITDLTKNLYTNLTFGENVIDYSRLDTYNRLNLLSHLCKYEHPECVSKANHLFYEFLNNTSNKVPVNIRSAVYCTGISGCNMEYWNKFLHLMHAENVAGEKIVMLNALGCTKNVVAIKELLYAIVNSVGIRQQDKTEAFISILSSHPENVQILLDHVINEYSNISRWGGISNIENLLSSLANKFTESKQIRQLEEFYNNISITLQLSAVLPNAIDNAKYNLLWAEKNIPIINNYMMEVSKSSTIINFSWFTIINILIMYMT